MSGNLDEIRIQNLTTHTVIGVHAWERLVKQEINLNMKLYLDTSIAAKTEKLDDTVDYRSLTKDVLTFIEGTQFEMIETLAEKIAELCLKCDNLEAVEIELNKPKALRHADSVGIKIHRKRTA